MLLQLSCAQPATTQITCRLSLVPRKYGVNSHRGLVLGGPTSAMLQSHLHSLIAKAHRYQEEPERFERVNQDPLTVAVHGANGDHQVILLEGHLQCDCDGFAHRGEGI